jgi:hypothetical protein
LLLASLPAYYRSNLLKQKELYVVHNSLRSLRIIVLIC